MKKAKYIGFTVDNQGGVCEYTDPLSTRSKALWAVKKKRSWLSGEAAACTRRADRFDPNAREGLRLDPCFC